MYNRLSRSGLSNMLREAGRLPPKGPDEAEMTVDDNADTQGSTMLSFSLESLMDGGGDRGRGVGERSSSLKFCPISSESFTQFCINRRDFIARENSAFAGLRC